MKALVQWLRHSALLVICLLGLAEHALNKQRFTCGFMGYLRFYRTRRLEEKEKQ